MGPLRQEGAAGVRVLNFGSMNLDYVYAVDHFVRPGETIASQSRSIKHGGKGLNQSIALARAGAKVTHAGCVGSGGESLKEMLAENGVDVSALKTVQEMQGHTVIQVGPDGENAIILFGGSNECVTEEQVKETLASFSAGDWLVLQNEINLLPYIVERAYEKGMRIALNPSPFNEKLKPVNLDHVSWLLVNEVEAEQITGSSDPEEAWNVLHTRYPKLSVLITLGKEGSVAFAQMESGTETVRQKAYRVTAVDTTAAGDTFTGYFIASLMEGLPLAKCMDRAAKAAAVSVTRHGAADSIPRISEIEYGHRDRAEPTMEEAEILYDAMWEYETTGRTEIRCPRCGNELDISSNGASASVICKTKGCIDATRRGL